MKTLILMRHGKSDWSDPALADRDRPLTARGLKAAVKMARHLRAAKRVPDLVLVSGATRAAQTWERMQPEMPDGTAVRSLRTLYPGPPSRLLAILRRLPAEAERVLVIGHNPGLQALALQLAQDGKKTRLRRLEEKFPTAALALIDLGIERWGDLGSRPGRLVDLVRPIDLD